MIDNIKIYYYSYNLINNKNIHYKKMKKKKNQSKNIKKNKKKKKWKNLTDK